MPLLPLYFSSTGAKLSFASSVYNLCCLLCCFAMVLLIPLISGLGNSADSDDNRPHLLHDMSSCPWVTAGVFHKATVSPLAPGKDFC